MNPLFAREYFKEFSEGLTAGLAPAEHLSIHLTSESSHFMRLSGGRVRQAGTVEDALVELIYVLESGAGELKTATEGVTLTGDPREDRARGRAALQRLRDHVPSLPADPFCRLPESHGSTDVVEHGELPDPGEAAGMILPVVNDLDFTGIYAAGTMISACANSRGQFHWHQADSFSLDYSVDTPREKAVKGAFAGRNWNQKAFEDDVHDSRGKMILLDNRPVTLERGDYRVFLAPAAVADLIGMFSWACVSEAAIRQGESPLRLVREGKRTFSPLFSLSEDFRSGLVPRFNALGELSPEVLPIIENGRLESTRVSSRAAREYGLEPNGADSREGLRSPVVAPGDLPMAEALERLGDGLFISNLHYLNWSDLPGGRITGMTRYACLKVEDGRPVAPIRDLRFDDSLFRLFGSELEALTRESGFIPEVGTYDFRQAGGVQVPGMLLRSMTFTL